MSGPVFVALVNPKSGGNVGASLLSRFKEILNEERVYNLSEDGGPKRALIENCQTENLRIIGEKTQLLHLLIKYFFKNKFHFVIYITIYIVHSY